jgi:maleylpyruvate isomerase
MSIAPEEVVPLIQAADYRLINCVSGLSAGDGHAATDLPGWTRAHIVAHLSTLAEAFIRQTSSALAGEQVPMYDGGRPARDAAIEKGALQPWDELAAGLKSHVEELESVWSKLEHELWNSPVTYRNSTLFAVLQCWWREVEIHCVDLKSGYGPDSWVPALSAHLIDFFAPRLPPHPRTRLRAGGTAQAWEFGSGTVVEITGSLPELASWLAQRSAGAALRVDPAGVLPELSSAWP